MDAALIDRVRSGDRKALALAITAVEGGAKLVETVGESRVIGITGPPGAGKSTLIAELISLLRVEDESVGVLAVDPSSPITGGALLGDRIRMQDHVGDNGVYVRSMATRGHLGGLSEAAGDALKLMGEAGFDWLIVETVGVGQSEVEVMNLADAVVLVVGPSWGDQVQADKAGIVEIADLFVVNKDDRPGSGDVQRALRETADIKGAKVLPTIATTGTGVREVWAEIRRLVG